MTEPRIQARERRLRRAARARGYRLVKSRRKGTGGSGYLVIDAEHDSVVVGAVPSAFSATLDQVESFLMDGSAPRLRRRVWPADEEPGSDDARENGR